jgi:hypothetical protein
LHGVLKRLRAALVRRRCRNVVSCHEGQSLSLLAILWDIDVLI